MSILANGLWKAPQNTKIPAVSHWLSFRASFTTVAATGAVTLSLPANYLSPGQLSPLTGTPSSYAPTFTQPDPNSEPQAGQRLVLQKMIVRDLVASTVAGTTAGTTVALQSNTSGTFAATPLSITLPVAASYAAGQYAVADMGTSQTGTFTANSQNMILVAGSTVQFVITAGTAGTAGNVGAFTIDLFGHWVQGF